MKISDLIGMCVRNLARRKFRTFLTVVGVVIGTCAIVVMISLGIGISVSQEEYLSAMGDLTVIDIYNYGQGTALDDDAIAQIEAMPGVEVVSPVWRYSPQNSYMSFYAGKNDRYEMWQQLIGVSPEAMEKLGYQVAEGELLSDSSGKKIQVLFGSLTAWEFGDTKKRWPNNYIDSWNTDEDGNPPDPFFQPMEEDIYTLYVYPSRDSAKELVYEMEVVGVLEHRDRDWNMMYAAMVSIDDLKKIKADYEKENGIKSDDSQNDGYNDVKVKVDHVDNVTEVQQAINNLGFQTSSLEEIREQMQQNTQQIQLILGGLGAMSLFVAAISITNTMIMSVYERTREIGVMKVLGCLVGNIRTVFLVEAGLIGCFGGVLGILISYVLSYLMNTFGSRLGENFGLIVMDEATRMSIIPPWLVALGIGFATLIGLVSGFYPANRAVRISALEAIKQE